mgnify:FL=1
MNSLDGNGKPCFKASTYDVNGIVLTYKDSTAEDLAKTYNKVVTAKVNGDYVGWSDSPSFIHFKKAQEDIVSIEEITYWHPFNTGKNCRYHAMLLIACGGEDEKQFYSDRLNDHDNRLYLTRFRGRYLPLCKPQNITFKNWVK